MELNEILRKARCLCDEAQMTLNHGDQKYAGDKLLELKNFLVENCDDTPEEETPEASADEAATEAEQADKEATQAQGPDVAPES